MDTSQMLKIKQFLELIIKCKCQVVVVAE